MTNIKNRRGYPQTMKAAVQRAGKASLKAKSTITTADIADDFNISKSTVCIWRRQASVNAQQPVGLARHQAEQATIKAYNTPTLQDNGTIMYRGVVFS